MLALPLDVFLREQSLLFLDQYQSVVRLVVEMKVKHKALQSSIWLSYVQWKSIISMEIK